MPRPKVSQINLHPPIPNPLPQHIKHAPRINLSRNPLRKLPLRRLLIPVQPGKPLPTVALRPANEPKEFPSINPKPSTKRILLPLPPPTKQLFFNPIFKGLLGICAQDSCGGTSTRHIDLSSDGSSNKRFASFGEQGKLSIDGIYGLINRCITGLYRFHDDELLGKRRQWNPKHLKVRHIDRFDA